MTDQPRGAIDSEIIGMLTGYVESPRQARDATHAAVLARDPDAVPTLIAIVSKEIDAAVLPPEQADELVGPAAHLLGDSGHSEAIEPLIKALVRIDPEDSTFDPVRDALGKMGAPALEPLLAAYATLPDPRRRAGVALALSHLGVKEERLFQLLVDLVKVDPFWGAHALRDYGDPRAVPHLQQALDDYDESALYPDIDVYQRDAEVTADLEAIQTALAAFGVELSWDEIEDRLDPSEPDDSES